jgi:prolyl-tRNA synthetase
VEAYSGTMGGTYSHEFTAPTDAGEDSIALCECGYAANLEKAESVASAPLAPDPEGDLSPEKFHTPGRKTIAEVAEFTGLPETSQIKSLVVAAGGELMLVLVRGDHNLSETKFGGVVQASEVRPAHPDEIRERFGADAGSLGPVGVRNMRVLADLALKGRRNMIAGANQDDYHLRHVTPGEDFSPEWQDLRQAAQGDLCKNCGKPLELKSAVEVGHIFKLGYKYSESMGLRILNAAGEEVTPIMGSYGIGIERILCAAVELYHDDDGMALPPSIAPFEVVITPVNSSDEAQREAADKIYKGCLSLGLDALLDDRDERPGVKFKDADLIGIPYRVTVGKKLSQGMVEVLNRRTRESTDVPTAGAPAFLANALCSKHGD